MSFIIDLESQDFKVEFSKFLNFYLNKSSQLDFIKKNHQDLYYEDLINFKKKPEFFAGNNLWLLKPAGKNRGIGIFIFNDLLKLNEYLQALGEKHQKIQIKKPRYSEILANGYVDYFYKGNEEIISQNSLKNIKDLNKKDEITSQFFLKNPKTARKSEEEIKSQNSLKNLKDSNKFGRRFVIQKYLESPLLIKGRKFDIRAWVLLDHKKNLHLFREGYIRTSSEKYDLKAINVLDNYFIHLTNNAIQKNSKNYQKFELGNQLSYSNFQVKVKFLLIFMIFFE